MQSGLDEESLLRSLGFDESVCFFGFHNEMSEVLRIKNVKLMTRNLIERMSVELEYLVKEKRDDLGIPSTVVTVAELVEGLFLWDPKYVSALSIEGFSSLESLSCCKFSDLYPNLISLPGHAAGLLNAAKLFVFRRSRPVANVLPSQAFPSVAERSSIPRKLPPRPVVVTTKSWWKPQTDLTTERMIMLFGAKEWIVRRKKKNFYKK